MQAFQPGDVPVPGYKLTAFLGKGSYGEVWQANGPGGVECALKFINLDNKAGLKEFRAIGRVKRFHHPNLVPIMAVWLRDAHGNTLGDNDAEGSLSLSMSGDKQLVVAMGLGRKSLLVLLEEARTKTAPGALPGGLQLRYLLTYMQDAAAGIDYLNVLDPEKGGNGAAEIIHCDIKPGNLLLVGGGRVQVCDYGVARALDRTVGADARMSMAAGTQAYAAPELINNEPGERTDQYCLAVTYYELRTGTLPFPEHRAMQAHILGKLAFDRVPEAEREVLKQATHMQPDRRFVTCREFVEALHIAADVTLPGHSGPIKWPPRRSTGYASDELPAPAGGRISDLLPPPPPPPPPPLPPRKLSDVLVQNGELVPDHTLVRQIGQGGYGQVWEARDKNDEPCALKLVRDLQGKGRHELDVLKQMGKLGHPHLLKITDWWVLGPDLQPVKGAGSTSGSGGVVAQAVVIRTPLADTNLRKRLDECRQAGAAGVPPDELVRHLSDAADAIDHLNRACDLVHRDIKPENLLLKGGQVLVSDFGLAKLVDRDGTAAQSTSSGMTQDYAAPEILTDKKVTTRSDQYSLAVTYHVLRTGRLPFPAGLSMLDLIRARASSRLDLTALTPDEQAALRPSLSANPADRYPTCRALADALTRAVAVPELVPLQPSAPTPVDTLPPADEPPVDTGATIGPGELSRVPGSKTDRPSVRDTPRDDRPAAPTRTPGPRYKRPDPLPKRGSGKKVARVVGVLAAVAALAGGAVYLARPPVTDPNAKLAELVETVNAKIATDDFAAAAPLVDEIGHLGTPEAEQKVRELTGQLTDLRTRWADAKHSRGVEDATAFRWAEADGAIKALEAQAPDRAASLRAEVTRLRTETRQAVGGVVERIARQWLVSPKDLDRGRAEIQKLPAQDEARDRLSAWLDVRKPVTFGDWSIRKSDTVTPIPTPAADLIAGLRDGIKGRPDRTRLPDIPAQANPEVEAWAGKVRTAWTAAAPLLTPPADEGKSGAKLVADYTAARQAVGALPAEDAKELTEAIQPKLAERVKAVIPSLDNQTPWDKLAEVCEVAAPTDAVKACRLECWAASGRQGEPPATLPAGAADTDGYAAYVVARSGPKDDAQRVAALTRLAGQIPPADSRPGWLNEYRAGNAHDLLLKAATTVPIRRPADGLRDDPYPAATAGRAVAWLAAAVRAADRAGGNVPPARRAETRYELVLAGRAAPRPPAAEVTAAAVALAKPGELERLGKPIPAQVRFWLTRGDLRPDAVVDSYAKVFELARRAKPPLPAGDLHGAVVNHLLDPKWIAGHAQSPEAKVALANVCFLAGREVRRRDAGWEDVPAVAGQVERTAAKLFDTAARLDPKPEYVTWHGISTVLGPDEPVARFPDVAGPTGRLLAGLVAKRESGKKPNLPDQLGGLQKALLAFRAAIDGLKGDADRQEELCLAYNQAADTSILLANFDPRDKAERKKALAEAVGWSDALLALAPNWPDAWDTKGCALEDQAWLIKDDPGRFAIPKGGYAQADKAYTDALNHRPSATAFMHRGRNKVKWAEDLYQHGRPQQVPLDGDKLTDARRDLEAAMKLLADGRRPASRAECHYWLAKSAIVERSAAREFDRARHFDEAIGHLRAAAEAAARPGGDQTGYRHTSLFEWAGLCYEEGKAANPGDKGRCREMAAAIEAILDRPEAGQALGPAVAGYHRVNALTLRFYAAGLADQTAAYYRWLTEMDRVVTDAVKPPCPAQHDWARVDILTRRADGRRMDPNRDPQQAVDDLRTADEIARRNPLVTKEAHRQVLTTLGRTLDTVAERAKKKGDTVTAGRLWSEAGDAYGGVVGLAPEPKTGWPAYLQLGLVRALAAEQIDPAKTAERATGYVPAVAALMAADAGQKEPGAVVGDKADADGLTDFRKNQKVMFTGENGQAGVRSFLTAAINDNPNGPAADGWRLARTGVDLQLGGPGILTDQDRAAAVQLATRVRATPPSPTLALLAEQVLRALSR